MTFHFGVSNARFSEAAAVLRHLNRRISAHCSAKDRALVAGEVASWTAYHHRLTARHPKRRLFFPHLTVREA
jgi:hypothetical protein